MQLFSRHTPSSYKALSIVAALLILFTVATSLYSYGKYTEILKNEEVYRLLPRDDATWGALQFYIESIKLEHAIHEFDMDRTNNNADEVNLRLDILFSRIEVLQSVLVRSTKSTAAQAMASSSINKKNQTLARGVLELSNLFSKLDALTSTLINEKDAKHINIISNLSGELSKKAAHFASLVNQASNETDHSIRDGINRINHEYRNALFIVLTTLLLLAFVSFFLFVSARKAEFESEKVSESLLASNEAKARFLSSMSHELRTPLNAIIGFSQLLSVNVKKGELSKVEEYEKYIVDSAEILLSLINQVLDLEKIEAGNIEINLSPVNLSDELLRTTELLETLAAKYGVTLSLGRTEKEVIETDALKLRQILINLTTNAIKYNTPGGQVVIESGMNEDGNILISIKDTGIGIPKEREDELFEPFNRLGKEAGNIEGSGIGLSICRSIADALGYQIGYHPNKGGGSVFWVLIDKTTF